MRPTSSALNLEHCGRRASIGQYRGFGAGRFRSEWRVCSNAVAGFGRMWVRSRAAGDALNLFRREPRACIRSVIVPITEAMMPPGTGTGDWRDHRDNEARRPERYRIVGCGLGLRHRRIPYGHSVGPKHWWGALANVDQGESADTGCVRSRTEGSCHDRRSCRRRGGGRRCGLIRLSSKERPPSVGGLRHLLSSPDRWSTSFCVPSSSASPYSAWTESNPAGD